MDRLRVALRDTERRLSIGRERSRSRNPSFQVKDVKKLPAAILSLYRYEPVNERDIRLVELQSPNPDNPKEVACKIKYSTLDSCPLFTAVSYMWGPASTPEIVYIEGKVLKVRESLFQLLLDLRRGEPRLLWIDALCIDQENMIERMEQVKIMGEIYAKANYVMTWLGSECKDGELGAQMLDLYARQLPLPPNADEHNYKAIEQLYRTAYWSRRWPIQEVLQGRTVIIYVAGLETSLSTMAEFALDSNFPWPQDAYVKSVRTRLRETLPVRLYQHRRAGKQNLTLTNMLLDYSTTECSDPHDIVFAFLSLTPRITDHINAGYDTDIIDLMLEVLRIACRLESLPPQRIISFAIFLRHQFQISRSSMADYAMRIRESGAQPLQGLKAEARYRGAINVELSAKQEQLVLAVRAKANPLVQLETLTLIGDREEGVYHLSRRQQTSSLSNELTKVSSQDLCAFGWQASESTSFFGSANAYVGLASAPVYAGDELWQFPDTNIALLMRHHTGGCSIVARAQLFQKPTMLDRLPSNDSDSNFLVRAWRGDSGAGAVRSFQLDVPLLLQLLSWVDTEGG